MYDNVCDCACVTVCVCVPDCEHSTVVQLTNVVPTPTMWNEMLHLAQVFISVISWTYC